MAQPLAPYVKLPEFDEYKEWFKDFAEMKREDGILQITWKTNDGPMHHSGMSHRAISQLTRILSMDWKNEIIIFTHIGDNWMIESDANGWETYSEPVSYTHLDVYKRQVYAHGRGNQPADSRRAHQPFGHFIPGVD